MLARGRVESDRGLTVIRRWGRSCGLATRQWHEGVMFLRHRLHTAVSSSLGSRGALSDTSVMSSPSVENRQVSENRKLWQRPHTAQDMADAEQWAQVGWGQHPVMVRACAADLGGCAVIESTRCLVLGCGPALPDRKVRKWASQELW